MLARRRDILWMIEHHPDAQVLGEPCATIYPSGRVLSDPEGFAEARKLWLRITAPRVPIGVVTNAAVFFLTTDPPRARELLARVWLRRRESPMQVARAYATAISPGIAHTRQGAPDAIVDWSLSRDCLAQLLNAEDAALIGMAATALWQPRPPTVPSVITAPSMPETELLRTAERLLLRAEELLPNSADLRYQLAQLYGLQVIGTGRSASLREMQFAQLAAAQSLGGDPLRSQKDYMNAAVETGRLDIAAGSARACLDRVARQQSKAPGDDLHQCNLVLGRVALRRGKIRTAGRFLVAAGRTSGSPVLGSFGPNMMLAQELLQVGRRKPVLRYLSLCSRFWKYHSKTDEWAAAMRAGKIPDFGGNLFF